MTEYHKHKISLDLNNAGFTAEDLQEIRPEFEDPRGNCRPVCYKWQWAPSAEGTDSFRILIVVYSAMTAVGAVWIKCFAEDMYKWAKSNLGEVFAKRRRGDGWTKIQFADKNVYIDYHPSTTEYCDAWLELPLRFEEIKALEYKNAIFEKSDEGEWTFTESDWEREL